MKANSSIVARLAGVLAVTLGLALAGGSATPAAADNVQWMGSQQHWSGHSNGWARQRHNGWNSGWGGSWGGNNWNGHHWNGHQWGNGQWGNGDSWWWHHRHRFFFNNGFGRCFGSCFGFGNPGFVIVNPGFVVRQPGFVIGQPGFQPGFNPPFRPMFNPPGGFNQPGFVIGQPAFNQPNIVVVDPNIFIRPRVIIQRNPSLGPTQPMHRSPLFSNPGGIRIIRPGM